MRRQDFWHNNLNGQMEKINLKHESVTYCVHKFKNIPFSGPLRSAGGNLSLPLHKVGKKSCLLIIISSQLLNYATFTRSQRWEGHELLFFTFPFGFAINSKFLYKVRYFTNVCNVEYTLAH